MKERRKSRYVLEIWLIRGLHLMCVCACVCVCVCKDQLTVNSPSEWRHDMARVCSNYKYIVGQKLSRKMKNERKIKSNQRD